MDKSNNHHPPSLGPGSAEGLKGREFDNENLPGQVQGYLIHIHGGRELESRHASVRARREGCTLLKEKLLLGTKKTEMRKEKKK